MKKQNSIQSDIKKIRKNKQLLLILVLLFVGLLFWIMVSLITSQSSEKISPELKKLATPLTPVIDVQTLESIENKRSYSEAELSQFTIYKVLETRDGRTRRIVPIEVTIEDLEPENNEAINQNNDSRSLLQQLDDAEQENQTATQSSEESEATSNPEESPAATTSPSPSPTAETGLGSQL